MAYTMDQERPGLPRPKRSEAQEPDRGERIPSEASQKSERDAIRAEYRAKLKACAKEQWSSLNERDAETYVEQGMSEQALALAKSEDQKTQWAREFGKTFVNDVLQKSREAGSKVQELLTEARSVKAVSLENMAEWKQRLKSGKWDWKTRTSFSKNEFSAFVSNWKTVAAKRKSILKEPGIVALKKATSLPSSLSKSDLQQFLSGKDFLNAEYPERERLVRAVSGALGKIGNVPSMDRLKNIAREKLKAQTDIGNLAEKKVDGWMQRIFQRHWTPNEIEHFLNGTHENSLHWLADEWRAARKGFNDIEKKRLDEGTPRNFYFLKLDGFLSLDFKKRMKYLESAERSFTLMEIAKKDSEKKVDGLKLDIGHALHMKDWNEAGELIAKATKEFPDDGEVRALKRDYEAHCLKSKASPQKHAKPTPEEIQKTMEEMRAHLRDMPIPMQKVAIKVLHHPDPMAFKRLRQLWYNRDWCRKHGYLDDRKEHEQAHDMRHKEATRQRQENGHDIGYEVEHVDGDTATQQAFRRRNRRPQVDYVDSGAESLNATAHVVIQERNNEWFGYWTTLIMRDVSFGKHKEVLDNNLYPLLQAKRRLAAANVQFSMGEDLSPANEKKRALTEPQHALAA